MFSKEQALEEVKGLLLKYEQLKALPNYNEEETKKDLLLPLFRALNWNMEDSAEVTAEESIARKRSDYGFRIDGIPKFYLEAKTLNENLDVEYAKQAINYAWLKSTTWAVLSNFSELKIYNADWKSIKTIDKLFIELKHDQYVDQFDKLWLLSRESFLTGELDKVAVAWGHERKRIPVTPVTDQLFEDLVKWRQRLTKNISSNKNNLLVLKDDKNLDESVQRILDRLIFIRVAEDKGLEPKQLRTKWRDWKLTRHGRPFCQLLDELFTEFDTNYDSNLFEHHLSDKLVIDDLTLNQIVEELYENTEGFEYNFADIDADVLGSIYEQYLGFMLKKFKKRTTIIESYTQRKKLGSYYTPTYIVEFIVRETIGKLTIHDGKTEKPKVLDMACGSGSFLIKALSFLERQYKVSNTDDKIALLKSSIYGVDLDPKATELARLNLLIQLLEKRTILPFLGKNIRLGNSLVSDPAVDSDALNWDKTFDAMTTQGGFDVVIGNPPYIDSEEMTRSQPKMRDYYSSSGLYSAAQGNWDIFCLFLEKGIQLVRPGGYLGMIVPNKLLSADYASALRKVIQQYKILRIRDYSTIHVFNAAVYPIVIILKKEEPNHNTIQLEVASQNEVGSITVEKTNEFNQDNISGLATWSPLFSKSQNALFEKITKESRTLESIAEVGGAATVSEAYETMEILKELTNHQHYFKFINTGTIDRYASLWGLKNTRIGKAYKNPIAKTDELLERLPNRANQAKTRKIIIGGMNKRLECFLDNNGEFLAGKSTVIVTEPKIQFAALLGILNSKLLSFCYKNMFQALSLSGGFMRIGPPQIRQLPVRQPTERESERLAELVKELIGLNMALNKVSPESDRGKNIAEQIIAKDEELDHFVYSIYNLSADEIRLVEAGFKET